MDRALVERARAGDREAFSSLAAASVDRMYAVAVLVLRDPSRAEDAVQEALITAWRDLRALREPDAWEAWSYRLTVRACQRAIRRAKARIVDLHVADPTGGMTADDTQTILDRELVERGLQRLGLDQRAVVVLHFYADLPLPEVADTLGIPVGTAKSRLHRALIAMRDELGDETPTTREQTA